MNHIIDILFDGYGNLVRMTQEIVKRIIFVKSTYAYKQRWAGICARTTRQNIKYLITNSQLCCEDWGIRLFIEHMPWIDKCLKYLPDPLNDLVNDYIGAVEISNSDRDEVLRSLEGGIIYKVGWSDDYWQLPCVGESASSSALTKIETLDYTLYILLYNHQNGYYSHDIHLRWMNKDSALVKVNDVL